MAQPHRSYLASQILSAHQTVSYRTLSRALQVHVNAAKRMLYDFYTYENAKKTGSVHATYLLAGSKKAISKEFGSNKSPDKLQNGSIENHDEPIPSSPPPFTSSMLRSSPSQQETQVTKMHCVVLVREEALDAVKSSYDTITSIHMYSLSPHRLPDMQTLSDGARAVYDDYFIKGDPLKQNSIYGTILNKAVRRRTGRLPLPTPACATQADSMTKIERPVGSISRSETGQGTEALQGLSIKQETTSSRPSSAGSTTTKASSTSTAAKQPTLKRDTSDIFKSFAKAKTNPKAKMARNDTDSSAGHGSGGRNEGKNQDSTKDEESESDEDEGEEEAFFLDTQTRAPAKKRPSVEKNTRAEREAKLRKMMEDDDENEERQEAKTTTTSFNDIDNEMNNKNAKKQSRDGQPEKRTSTSMKNRKAAKQADPDQEAEQDGKKDSDVDKDVDMDWSDSDQERKSAKPSNRHDQAARKAQQKQVASEAESESESEVGEHDRPQDHEKQSTGHPQRLPRRRGKRKILKKKTMKDEDGYLVTREEAVWESFSEEEQTQDPGEGEAKKGMMKQSQGQGRKSGSGGIATGGSGIMSFFQKK